MHFPGTARRPASPLLSMHLALLKALAGNLPCVLVSGLRVVRLCGAVELLLVGPARVHTFRAPFEAAPGCTDRLVANDDKNGVRVGGALNPQCDPAAARPPDGRGPFGA